MRLHSFYITRRMIECHELKPFREFTNCYYDLFSPNILEIYLNSERGVKSMKSTNCFRICSARIEKYYINPLIVRTSENRIYLSELT